MGKIYELVTDEQKNTEKTKIYFYVVKINDITPALEHTYRILSDYSWIEKLSDEMLKKSYELRMKETIEKLKIEFKKSTKLSSSTGEYLISITSEEVISDKLEYKKIPLGELIGKRVTGNGGFDYFLENNIENYIIFGEAKYLKEKSAYSKALDQIVTFINKGKDNIDYADIKRFVNTSSGQNLIEDVEGFSAGFSYSLNGNFSIDKFISKAKYCKFLDYNELIMVGVQINEK